MKRILLGTDWWTDCDDAVALRVLSRFVREGKAQLLGISINACMPYSVASLKGFLMAEGIGDIPIGIDRSATDFGGTPPYQRRLAETYAPTVTNEDGEDAVRLYRRLLASACERIEIVEIGYLQVLAAVLKSGADDISPQSGLELVREHVSKMWVMAGKWDGDGERENNFCRNPRSRLAGKEFCELCPVPVTFLGWEIGYGVLTGGGLARSDHLHHVLADHGSPNGRHSWDPMLVHLALIGDEEQAGYGSMTGIASVDAETGANFFRPDPHDLHRYVIKKQEDAWYAGQIDHLL